ELEREYRAALSEYGAPDALIERIFRTKSTQIDYISEAEFNDLVPASVPWHEEYLHAKCEGLSESERQDRNAIFDARFFNRPLPFSQGYRDFIDARAKAFETCVKQELIDNQARVLALYEARD
ncbi:MAG: hypothetical protein AAFY03_04320, partial [Pseudomonadota bacterium]